MTRLEQVLKGIKSVQARDPPQSKPARLPITPDLLLKMKQLWEKKDNVWDRELLWAAATLCFFGFLDQGRSQFPQKHHSTRGLI